MKRIWGLSICLHVSNMFEELMFLVVWYNGEAGLSYISDVRKLVGILRKYALFSETEKYDVQNQRTAQNTIFKIREMGGGRGGPW